MPKIFVASFNRASDGGVTKLIKKMKERDLYTNNYKKADYILAVGDRTETFDFVLKRYRENKPIIHLWAGEISQGTHDEVYRHAMTMMSMMQLCTTDRAEERVLNLCKSIDKKPNQYLIGNIMLDNMEEIDESVVPNYQYDLILYNPPTLYPTSVIQKEIEEIFYIIDDNKYIWIEPNGDMGSEVVKKFINQKNLPRPQFLGLIKHCNRFITNSSCQYYEAQFLMNVENIIHIGKRNIERESKYSNMTILDASDNIIRCLEILK